MATSKIPSSGKNTEFGTTIQVTSAEMTAPADGYFVLVADSSPSSYVSGYINGERIGDIVGSSNNYVKSTIYVRKGMRLKIMSNTGNAYFYPLG